MKSFLTLLVFIIGSKAYTQTTINLQEVSSHVGDSVRVCGKVAGTRYLEQASNSPTFLNLGAAYPDQLLTLVIWKELRIQFEKEPEVMYKDQEVCVVGKITMFRNHPQIVVYRKDQLIAK